MIKSVQAKHIDEGAVLRAVEPSRWGIATWELAERLGFPEKVVLAKMRSMVKRGLVDGCTCGCRGGFALTEAGKEMCNG